ncbi:MAG TPA: hypothetical protein V6D17_24330 [Candidatus Obscuribacterales bacterium]
MYENTARDFPEGPASPFVLNDVRALDGACFCRQNGSGGRADYEFERAVAPAAELGDLTWRRQGGAARGELVPGYIRIATGDTATSAMVDNISNMMQLGEDLVFVNYLQAQQAIARAKAIADSVNHQELLARRSAIQIRLQTEQNHAQRQILLKEDMDLFALDQASKWTRLNEVLLFRRLGKIEESERLFAVAMNYFRQKRPDLSDMHGSNPINRQFLLSAQSLVHELVRFPMDPGNRSWQRNSRLLVAPQPDFDSPAHGFNGFQNGFQADQGWLFEPQNGFFGNQQGHEYLPPKAQIADRFDPRMADAPPPSVSPRSPQRRNQQQGPSASAPWRAGYGQIAPAFRHNPTQRGSGAFGTNFAPYVFETSPNHYQEQEHWRPNPGKLRDWNAPPDFRIVLPW